MGAVQEDVQQHAGVHRRGHRRAVLRTGPDVDIGHRLFRDDAGGGGLRGGVGSKTEKAFQPASLVTRVVQLQPTRER